MRTVFEKLKRNAYGLSAFAFLGAAMAPVLIAAQPVSAGQMTERSITMSSSATSATAQTYQLKFKAQTAGSIQGIVVDFCDSASSGSPIIGSANCSLPAGMTVGATVGSVGGELTGTWSATRTQASNRTLVLTKAGGDTLTSGGDVEVTVTGFTNPSNARTFYARVLTFTTTALANAYTSGTTGAYVDAGGVALAATQAVNVTATVQETLTFCVSGAVPTDGCGGVTSPTLVLGTGTPAVLDPAAVYPGTVNYQLSTNAVGATNVRIKGADAGLRSGSNLIDPLELATTTAVAMQAGQTSSKSAFGIRSAGASVGGTGTISLVAPYDHATNYGNDPTSITSTYGDIIATATGALLNKNVPLTFGATAGPTTPAGVYTGAFSLIASSSY